MSGGISRRQAQREGAIKAMLMATQDELVTELKRTEVTAKDAIKPEAAAQVTLARAMLLSSVTNVTLALVAMEKE